MTQLMILIYIYIYIYRLNKNKIKNLFKYCADVENHERFKGFSYIYIYIYIDEVNSTLSIIYNLTNNMYLVADCRGRFFARSHVPLEV